MSFEQRDNGVKRCRSCDTLKLLCEFNKDKGRPDDHAVYCKLCNRKIQAKWYEATHWSVHPLKKLRTASAEMRLESNHRKDKGGCWIWLGAPCGANGYGRLKVFGKYIGAHRYSWMVQNGPVPEGLYVLHKCDTPLCVNPDHLFLGTMQDNSDDCFRKGRKARGGSHYMSRLSEKDVMAIRSSNASTSDLASRYDVTRSNIRKVITGRTWAWLTN